MKNHNSGITLDTCACAFFPFWGEGFFVPFSGTALVAGSKK
jgi:hypothetical protein